MEFSNKFYKTMGIIFAVYIAVMILLAIVGNFAVIMAKLGVF